MIALSGTINAVDYSEYDADKMIAALMESYRALPRHIAKKHAKAAIRRVMKPGVPILRRHTPPLGTRRGRRKKGEKARSTGSLRRAVTTRAGQTGRNDGWNTFVWGVLGYRAGAESRKAIWNEFGTRRGMAPRRMVEKTMSEYGGPARSAIVRELAVGLEKAAKDKRMQIVAAKSAGAR